MAERTQVRLALSLNGGVSLAVWMSGVVHELELVCRASRDRRPAEQSRTESEHYRQWQEFCRDRNIEVVVDIIAGTSAGGINGAILAKTLACGAPLPNLRELWVRHAALQPGKVLWPNGDDAKPSVLNGPEFADVVADCLREIGSATQPRSEPMTLFVTATALGPSVLSFADATGKQFDVPDHRRLYRFRSAPRFDYDGGTRQFTETVDNDFAKYEDALAQTARASAGFPLAFAPVLESSDMAALLHPRRGGGPDDRHPYLMDGGILDNAPVGPVLEEIATRRADARICRKLVYVVPSDGVSERLPGKPGDTREPTWVQILSQAIAMPRETDFRSDIEQLQDILRDSRVRISAATAMLTSALGSTDMMAKLTGGAEAMRTLYRASRISGTLGEIRDELAVRGLTVPRLEQPDTVARLAAASVCWALGAPSGWQYGISGAQRSVRVLLSDLRQRVEAGADQDPLLPVAQQLSTAMERISAVNRAVAERLYMTGSPIMAAGCPDDTIIDEVQRVFEELQVPTTLDELITDAVRGYAPAVGWPEADVATALRAIEVVTGAIAVRSEDQAPPPFGFVRLGPDIAHPAIEPLPEPDARPRGDDKLYGTRLLHFGAFGAEHWRRWDFTWGRLDAAAHLARLFDGSADTGPLEMQILTEEGLPLAEVRQELRQIDEQLTAHVGKQDRPLLDRLRRDPTCRDTLPDLADSVMRFLAQDDDRLHSPVLSAAGYVRAVLQADPPPGMRWKQRAARLLLRRYRRRAWRWLSGVETSVSASNSTPFRFLKIKP